MQSEWSSLPLESALEVLIDYRGKSPPKSEEGVPVISAKVVKGGRVLYPIEQTIDPEYYPVWMTRGLPKVGDVVMTTEGPMGEVAQLNAQTAKYALGQRIVCMRGRKGVLDNTFLKFLLISPTQQAILHSFATGTTVAGISQKSLRSIPLVLPPYGDQVVIGRLLGGLDDKIELNRRMNETLEAMARATFKDWFVDFGPTRAKAEGRAAYLAPDIWSIFPACLDEEGKPEGWEAKPLSAFFSIIGGGTPKTAVDDYWNGDIPWFSVADTPQNGSLFVFDTEKSITKRGLDESSVCLVPAGTTIISARGTVGNLAIAARDMTFNQSCYALRGSGVPGDCFVFLAAQQMVTKLQAMAHGSVFSTITRSTFEAISLDRPSDVVLHSFEAVAKPIFAKIKANVDETRILAQTRDLLLPKLMSGEIRVRDAKTGLGATL
jgi:type I restriction enzyme S subunit